MMNGVLILNKPEGVTSGKILNKVKNILKVKKAGHTGTLDPFATGVLPICINEATKVIPYIPEDFKEYTGTIELGLSTDTLDITGKVTRKNEVGKIKESDILDCFCKYKGNLDQLPPMYSAVRKNGIRLYSLARKGLEVERKTKEIKIEELELLDFESPHIKFYVKCTKGTYIRSLSNDIGNELKCGGVLKELKRISSGPFSINNSSTIEDVENSNYKIIGLNSLLSHFKSVEVNENTASKIREGKRLIKKYFTNRLLPVLEISETITFKNNNELVAIAETIISTDEFKYIDEKEVVFKVLRVFNIN